MADVYGFDEPTANRLVGLAGKTPRRNNQPPEPRRPEQPIYMQSRLALSDGSGISARSGTTAGNGTVTLQYLDGSTITANTDTLTVYNWSKTAAAAETYVWVHQDSLGTWWILGEDC